MNAEKKKKLIVFGVIVGIIIVLVAACLIYDKTTEESRATKYSIKSIEETISDYRLGTYDYTTTRIMLQHFYNDNPEFTEFVSKQISEIMENEEYELLTLFTYAMNRCKYHSQEVKDTIINYAESLDDFEKLLSLWKALKYSDAEFYKIEINRNDKLITSYIKKNGAKKIMTESGTGYYADKTDESYKQSGNSVTTRYRGDFMIISVTSLQYTSDYHAEWRTDSRYYFCDNIISELFKFNSLAIYHPDDYLVYIDDYLLNFDKTTGKIISYMEITLDN